MNIATTLRYVDLKEGGNWDHRYYIMNDYPLMARKFGAGLVAIMSEHDIEGICANCDGLIIPGSGTNIDPTYYGGKPFDPPNAVDEYSLDAKLMKHFFEAGKPIFGICGGHQAINVFFGGTLTRVQTDTPHYYMDEKAKVHPVNIKKDSFVYDVFQTERHMTNSYHAWCVGKLAPNFEVVATADDGTIEAIEWKEKHIYGTQWHPEQTFHTGNEIEHKFFENFLRICEECKSR